MKLIPAYMVSYKGSFHPAGEPFRIASEDAEMMREHGEILEEESVRLEEPSRAMKRGRPRKAQE